MISYDGWAAVHIATKTKATTAKKRKIFLLLIGRYFTHLVNRVDYRHALPIFHITSTRRVCQRQIQTHFVSK